MGMRFNSFFFWLVTGLSLNASSPAGAQVISCLQAPSASPGEPCRIERQGGASQLIAVQLSLGGKPVESVPVAFSSPSKADTVTVPTNSNGVASVLWAIPPDADTASVEVKADAKWAGWHAQPRTILLVSPKMAVSTLVKPREKAKSGNRQTWYVGKQLPKPITVEVQPTAPGDCAKSVVVFKAIGDDAAAYPDSVRAHPDDGVCIAQTNWKLGKTVGLQSMRASVAGDTQHSQVFSAKARAMPWIAAGLALTWLRREDIVSAKSETLQIVTKSSAAETTFTVTRSVSKPDRSNSSQFKPILGINTPLHASWDWVRWTIAADAQHLTTDWYTGLSLTQLVPRIYNEDIGVDFMALLHVARRDVLDNVVACSSPTPICNTHKETLVGGGFAVEFNASGFLSAVLGLFPSK